MGPDGGSAANSSQRIYALEDNTGKPVDALEEHFTALASTQSDSLFDDIGGAVHPRSRSVRGNRSELLVGGSENRLS